MDRLPSNEESTWKTNSNNEVSEKPTPDNFEEFFPWACKTLGLEETVVITRVQATESDRKDKNLMKEKHKQQSSHIALGSEEEKRSGSAVDEYDGSIVKITIVCDNSGNLQQLKFDKNKKIPRTIFKLLGLILEFHTSLMSITINKGLNKVNVYELNKLLVPTITDICLDGTYMNDANYDILLENKNNLTNLSLSRCKINDEIVRKIAEKIAHPLPASNTLSLLNLASNRITDTGAKYLAVALKTNRHLLYLNLSDNAITDEGSTAILDVLDEFILSHDELKSSRYRFIKFWREKHASQMTADHGDHADLPDQVTKGKKLKGKTTSANIAKEVKLIERDLVNSEEFNDPFAPKNIIEKGGLVYCHGNNYLAYLNLSYNDISYLTVKKILSILVYQKFLGRKPKGLVNVSVEGNRIPENCSELYQINDILQSSLVANTTTTSRRKSRVLLM